MSLCIFRSIMWRNYQFVRQYVGPLRACILDWSGTTADKYVLAPAVVFVDVFKKHNVPISMDEARGPMGLRKDLHIKVIIDIFSNLNLSNFIFLELSWNRVLKI